MDEQNVGKNPTVLDQIISYIRTGIDPRTGCIMKLDYIDPLSSPVDQSQLIEELIKYYRLNKTDRKNLRKFFRKFLVNLKIDFILGRLSMFRDPWDFTDLREKDLPEWEEFVRNLAESFGLDIQLLQENLGLHGKTHFHIAKGVRLANKIGKTATIRYEITPVEFYGSIARNQTINVSPNGDTQYVNSLDNGFLVISNNECSETLVTPKGSMVSKNCNLLEINILGDTTITIDMETGEIDTRIVETIDGVPDHDPETLPSIIYDLD